ncbi:hypothetical protein P154DRAFT_589321 [Amniculicola lignicola CBS 123094]|uniref:Uncharacterized protein n=1 Tax=Amniculicola lignicola CBS 123094 TaxID=1392246 RepID=A0A6A5VZY1_9PLEO|nr:hypothetical protein P154DRAFT_589321 [Amniculicola lignicola CBS 123094]
MAVLAHTVRWQLTTQGTSFGLIGIPFTFQNLSLLWSQDLWSHRFQGSSQNFHTFMAKSFLITLLVICCILAAVVGPASALLFLPSESWMPVGKTEFYLAGSESQLFPQKLTEADIGPSNCTEETPPPMHFTCLHGGHPMLKTVLTPEGVQAKREWTAYMKDAKRPRMSRAFYPLLAKVGNAHEQWAYTLHGASLTLAGEMVFRHDTAWEYASAMMRRLKGGIILKRMLDARLPITRTVCGPLQRISNSTKTLPFPVLQEKIYWRTTNATTRDELRDGTLRDLPVDVIQRRSPYKIRTAWLAPPQDFGGSTTAALAFIMQNSTMTIGMGCSVDARWARGETSTNDLVSLNVWDAFIGHQPEPDGPQFMQPKYTEFLEPDVAKYLSGPITADQDFLNAISPHMDKSLGNGTLSPTTFDDILMNTQASSMIQMTKPGAVARAGQMTLEAAVTTYFLDVLSRVGWHLQFTDFDSSDINPILQYPYYEGNNGTDKILRGEPVFTRPTNMSTVALRQEWFSYSTGWRLNESNLWISVTILGVHLLIALTHTVITLITGVSSESWDSITEVLALAYNSVPRGEELKNCGAGIRSKKTLEQQVRIVAVKDGNGNEGYKENKEKVQLVFCEEASGRDKFGENADVDEGAESVVVGREYG